MPLLMCPPVLACALAASTTTTASSACLLLLLLLLLCGSMLCPGSCLLGFSPQLCTLHHKFSLALQQSSVALHVA